MARYNGPIIDAHHHLWAPLKGNYSWLLDPSREALAHDVTPEDYANTFAGFSIAGSVVVEGHADDPVLEAKHAASWGRQSGKRVATGFVAHCPLDAPDIHERLAELRTNCPAVVGVRDIVAYVHDRPSFARAADLLSSPRFKVGLAALAAENLVFDLMLEPNQIGDAHTCLKTIPQLKVAIEHAGAPRDQSPAGLHAWRRSMAKLAELPNAVVKVSALQVHDSNWTVPSLRRVFDPLTDLFGPSRMMMGTDYPVHDLACPGPEAINAFIELTQGWNENDQAAFFFDTAVQTYALEISAFEQADGSAQRSR
ncbi:MAG: amidohydrolase family protein [Pseudomonadota bacterium]